MAGDRAWGSSNAAAGVTSIKNKTANDTTFGYPARIFRRCLVGRFDLSITCCGRDGFVGQETCGEFVPHMVNVQRGTTVYHGRFG